MQNLILDNISLILLLPLWIFLIIMCGRFFSVYVNKNIIYALTLLSSFFGIGMCSLALFNLKETVIWNYPFIKINEFTLYFGLQADKTSLIMALLLFIVSFAVQIYSISYVKNDKKNYKFFAFLNLFNFSMAFLLFSPNLFQMYVFWELVGIISYLLIGFEYQNVIKSKASQKVFLMNRVGDTALIAGIILVSYYMYSYSSNCSFVTLSFEDFNAISTLLLAYTSMPLFYVICALFIIAAAVKSAQFPFYTWLQDAMEAKLPVSALLHSATMVAAGVYLVIRMMPFFTLTPELTNAITIIGLVTAVICSLLASIETNLKKILAYSTSANLGIMFIALGVFNVKAALIYLLAHGFIKSSLFILLPKENDVPKINFILLNLSALSLAGILFAGLSAKEILFNSLSYKLLLPYLFMFVCFMTGFYITRFAAIVYKNHKLNNDINMLDMLSFIILLLCNVVLYLLLRNNYRIAEPFVAAIGGISLALLVIKNKKTEWIKGSPKILEKLYGRLLPLIYKKTANVLAFIDNKVFANYMPVVFISKLPVKIVHYIEEKIMNKSVKIIGDAAKEFSRRDMLLQSGNVQTYNAYAFILVTIIIAFVIMGYTLLFAG